MWLLKEIKCMALDWFWLVCAMLFGVVLVIIMPFMMAIDLFKRWCVYKNNKTEAKE